MKVIVYCPYYMSSHWLRDYSLVLEISDRLPLTVCCLLTDHWLICWPQLVKRWITPSTGKNLYPVHGAIGFRTTHPLNRGLSSGAIALIHRLNNRSQVAGSMHDLQKQCQSVFCATVRCLPFIIFFFKTISNKKQLLDSVFAL